MRASARGTTLLALAAAIGLAAASSPPASAQGAAPAPTVRVVVEKVDPSGFPDVDVWFRVVDTVPSSKYHEIQTPDVKVEESPGGRQAFASVKPGADNFKAPKIRPLAMTLAVDRSSSVEPILQKLRTAAVRFLQTMSDNGPLPDDAVSMVLFCGSNDLERVGRLPLTTDRDGAAAYADANLARVAGGTPLHKAWNLAVRDVADSNYPARGVLMLSDGKNFPRNMGPDVESILQAAVSNAVPMFNFAFVEFEPDGQVARGSVYRPDMMRMSDVTGGAYFEPIPPFASVADLPTTTGDPNDPAALDDKQALDYARTTLELMRNSLANKGPDEFAALQPAINRLLDPGVKSLDELRALDLASDARLKPAAAKLSADDLTQIDAAVVGAVSRPVTEQELDNFYVDQVANMFTKVRAGLKRLYKVTYRSTGQCDGQPRDVRVTVAYQSRVANKPIALSGQGVGRFITPVIAEEDLASEAVSTLNPESPIHEQLFGAAQAPRGGAWRGGTEIAYSVDLMAPGASGEPAVLASLSPAGELALSSDPESPVATMDAADRELVAAYLRHLEFSATADAAAGSLSVKLTARVPTCVRDPKQPLARPTPNKLARGFRQLLWYRVQPRASRTYDYWLTVPTEEGLPGQEQAAAASVAEEMPLLVAFVADTTAPTVAIVVAPQDDVGRSRLEMLETPVDSAERPRPQVPHLTGPLWSPGQDAAYSATPAPGTTVFPLTLGGQTVDGIHVSEDVRLKITVVAKDNFDAAKDARQLTLAAGSPPAHNLFPDDELNSPEARDGLAPFLARLSEGAPAGPGVTAHLLEDGKQAPIEETTIFRASNATDGRELALEVRAEDASGNVTRMVVPIRVRPVEMRFRKMAFESRRAD